MSTTEVIALLGRLTGAIGAAMLLPCGLALALGEPAWLYFAVPAAVGFVLARLSTRFPVEENGSATRSSGTRTFLFVVLAWTVATIFGAAPYVGIFGFGFVVDGLFESASGFSTTGATIFPEVESLPRSLLLWRALTQWLGGLGIVIVFVWLLGRRQWGVDVLTAEAPGPTPEKTEPKVAETARDTVLVGAVLTAVLAVLLLILDVPAFDAICHSLTTLATGGFSTRNESLGAFSPTIQWVITGFMLLGGVRFAIHIYGVRRLWARISGFVRRLRNRKLKRVSTPPAASYLRDPELRAYLGLIAVATAMLTASLLLAGEVWTDGLRHAAFQTVAVITTSGFSTTDYNQWSDFARMVILLLMFAGGCVGSTAGSIKVLRWVVLMKKAPLALRVVHQPHTDLRVHVGGTAAPAWLSATIGDFVLLFLGVAIAGALALVAMGIEPLTAISASAAAVTNVGPGLGQVGPSASYAWLPAPAKLLLATLMIAGRLEVVTVAVLLFTPLRRLRARFRSSLS